MVFVHYHVWVGNNVYNLVADLLPCFIILDIQFEKLTIFTTHICHTNHINVCQNQNYICSLLTNGGPPLNHVTSQLHAAAGKLTINVLKQRCRNVGWRISLERAFIWISFYNPRDFCFHVTANILKNGKNKI